jgi:hypothetical protein
VREFSKTYQAKLNLPILIQFGLQFLQATKSPLLSQRYGLNWFNSDPSEHVQNQYMLNLALFEFVYKLFQSFLRYLFLSLAYSQLD